MNYLEPDHLKMTQLEYIFKQNTKVFQFTSSLPTFSPPPSKQESFSGHLYLIPSKQQLLKIYIKSTVGSSLCQDHQYLQYKRQGLSQFKSLTLVFQTKKSQSLRVFNKAQFTGDITHTFPRFAIISKLRCTKVFLQFFNLNVIITHLE